MKFDKYELIKVLNKGGGYGTIFEVKKNQMKMSIMH